MAALVHRHHRVAAAMEILGDAVPQAEVRRQAVDEHEGRRPGRAGALLDVKRHPICHRDPQFRGRIRLYATLARAHDVAPCLRARW